MESLVGEWLVMVVNAILIAALVTIPLLVGLIVLRVFRQGILQDRRRMDEQVLSRLEDIAGSLAAISRQLEGVSKQ